MWVEEGGLVAGVCASFFVRGAGVRPGPAVGVRGGGFVAGVWCFCNHVQQQGILVR